MEFKIRLNIESDSKWERIPIHFESHCNQSIEHRTRKEKPIVDALSRNEQEDSEGKVKVRERLIQE